MDSAHVDTPPATPAPGSTDAGQVIADRYRLIKKLGEGAMGAVFLAEHVHMRKRFALKLLLPTAMNSPEIVARFEREAIAAGNIDHPGVCAATDFGRLADGSFFLVLEYVDGRSLRSIVHDGALQPDRAIVIARQILAALAAAHGKGVVHRDIKPENVMIGEGPNGEDVVKVLDFGIAKLTDAAPASEQRENLTRMGAIYGTPAYMAPEQAMGKTIDHRVDLYAVGVMLHEMITGKPPFDGDGIIILARHVNDAPPPLVSPLDPNGVSIDLASYVGRLLAKKADDRPESAQQAIAELDLARSSLAAFPASTLPTGLHRGAVQANAATIAGAAATVVGSPAPPSVAPKTSPLLAARDKLEARLSPLAKRAGVPARHLLFALSGAAALFLLLLTIVIFRPAKDDDDDEAERRPRKRPAVTAPAKSVANDGPLAMPEDSAEKASAAPSSSTSSGKGGGGGGGGVKGIGRKIKSLF